MIEDKTNEETQLADRNQGWSRNQAQVIVLFGATTIALYLCYRLALPVLPALAWASALAVVGHPLHAWILRRMGRPNLAAGLAVAVVVVAIVAPSFLVVQRMVQEATDGLKTIQAAGWWQAVETNSIAAPVLAWIENHIALSSAAERLQAWLVGQVSNWVKSSVWVLMELFITLFFLFYFFRDRAMALDLVRSLMPLSDAETDRIFTRVADTIYATLYGTLVVSLAQGVLGGLMFWWLGLPSPLLWGAVMALVAVVRMLGPFIVWIPAAL